MLNNMNGGIDTEEKLTELTDFSGGLNIKAANDLIADNQATVRVNCHTNETGAIVKRGGRDYLYSTEIVAGKGIYGLYRAYEKDGTEHFWAHCSTKIYEWSGTNFGSGVTGGTVTASKMADYATLNNIPVMCNGTEAPLQYVVASDQFSAVTGSPPTMLYNDTSRNRMYMYGHATANRCNLYYSGLGNPNSWDTTNDFVGVSPDDGDFLTGTGTVQGLFIVFKNNSVRILGNSGDPSGWELGDVRSPHGCTARHTICNATIKGVPVLIYLSGDGVYAFDGSKAISLTSSDIDPIFSSTTYTYRLSKGYADTSCAVVHNGKYYLSYPYGSATLPNWTIVYDLVNGGWSYYNYGVNCFSKWDEVRDTGQLYSGQTALGYVQREEYGNDDFDADITMQYKTKYLAPFGKNIINQYWREYVRAEPTASTTLRTILDTDFQAKQLTKNHYLAVSAPKWDTPLWDDFEWAGGEEMYNYDETLQQELNGRQIAIEFYNVSQVGLKIHYGGLISTAEYLKRG